MTNLHTMRYQEVPPPAEALQLYLGQIKSNNQYISSSLKDLAQLIQNMMENQIEQQDIIRRQAARIKYLEAQQAKI